MFITFHVNTSTPFRAEKSPARGCRSITLLRQALPVRYVQLEANVLAKQPYETFPVRLRRSQLLWLPVSDALFLSIAHTDAGIVRDDKRHWCNTVHCMCLHAVSLLSIDSQMIRRK